MSDPDAGRHQADGEADEQRGARAPDGKREDVLSLRRRSEQVVGRGWLRPEGGDR